jgi:hypothetical protein
LPEGGWQLGGLPKAAEDCRSPKRKRVNKARASKGRSYNCDRWLDVLPKAASWPPQSKTQARTEGRKFLKIKKRIQPGPDAQAIRCSRFVFMFPSQPHRVALKEQFN